MNEPTVVYYEYYPHYMGTLTRRREMPASDLINIASYVLSGADDEDEMFDTIEEFDDYVAELNGKEKGTFAFSNALIDQYANEGVKQAKAMMTALKTKGFWVGEWEEGTHYIALKEQETAAEAALRKIECEHFEESEEW